MSEEVSQIDDKNNNILLNPYLIFGCAAIGVYYVKRFVKRLKESNDG